MGTGTGHGHPREPIPGAADPADRPLRIDPVRGPGRLHRHCLRSRPSQRRLDAHCHHRRNEAESRTVQALWRAAPGGCGHGCCGGHTILILVGSEYTLEVIIILLAGLGIAIKGVNYAYYAGAIACAALIAADLPQPTDYAAEGRRVYFTMVGVRYRAPRDVRGRSAPEALCQDSLSLGDQRETGSRCLPTGIGETTQIGDLTKRGRRRLAAFAIVRTVATIALVLVLYFLSCCPWAVGPVLRKFCQADAWSTDAHSDHHLAGTPRNCSIQPPGRPGRRSAGVQCSGSTCCSSQRPTL